MYEKVNPSHPDKIADRIAGAIVDLAYRDYENPEVAAEVLIGHGVCHVIIETGVEFNISDIEQAIKRIAGDVETDIKIYPQDKHLSDNQREEVRCGDNGIFKGMPMTEEQKILSNLVRDLYDERPTDGKYIISLADNKLIACQSCVNSQQLKNGIKDYITSFTDMPYGTEIVVNPLGEWSGGTDVDTGATNRKLGSDMGDSVTGGGLHGKDLSKADVSVNIYAFIKAQEIRKPVELHCAIGDTTIDGKPYSQIVDLARNYISSIGGFEKFAEWGLI